MAQNPLVEQAKQGNVNAISSLMNKLLKSQGMLANVEGDGDRLEILIESDLRSLDDEMRIPKREILVGMLKKWFLTLEIRTIARVTVSWQQTGFDEPAWTEEIQLVDSLNGAEISENIEIAEPSLPMKIPPLPSLPPKSMLERNDLIDHLNNEAISQANRNAASSDADLDEMFGEETAIPTAVALVNHDSEPDLAFLPDVSAIADLTSNEDAPTESTVTSDSPLNALLKTPIVAIQFAQYIVICVVIIFGLRGIHAVFGGSVKSPKSPAISMQIPYKS